MSIVIGSWVYSILNLALFLQHIIPLFKGMDGGQINYLLQLALLFINLIVKGFFPSSLYIVYSFKVTVHACLLPMVHSLGLRAS